MFWIKRHRQYRNVEKIAERGDLVRTPTGNEYRIGDRGVRLVDRGRVLSVGLMIYPVVECKYIQE